jgi:iron(III) transport system ATP-binding protein
MSAGKPYLRVTDVTKKFGEFTALSSVSLEVMEGEFVCFLGPSGCGKTTLLRAIAGLDFQTAGRIEQAGEDISELPPAKRDFGIVFQSYALFPNLSVAANVGYGLENRRMPKADIQKRVDELLGLVGLADQGPKYPAQLSGGQQQRVALARALAPSPGLLLLDEPLSALDAKVRVRLRLEIKELQRRLGVTTIMVTHDQEEALSMADRIVVMDHGKIEQVGTPEEIYSSPATPFVADFIGAMNFLPAQAGEGSVSIGSAKFAANIPAALGGNRVIAAIRPEDIQFHEVAGGDDNSIEAVTGHMEFLGTFFRVALDCEALGETELFADISPNMVRRQSLEPGRKLMIRLPEEFIRVFPATPS